MTIPDWSNGTPLEVTDDGTDASCTVPEDGYLRMMPGVTDAPIDPSLQAVIVVLINNNTVFSAGYYPGGNSPDIQQAAIKVAKGDEITMYRSRNNSHVAASWLAVNLVLHPLR